MTSTYQNKLKILFWILAVYVLSFICYVPTLLDRHGVIFPHEFLLLKYLFVCIPAMTTIALSIYEHSFQECFARMFSGKITIRHILNWIAVLIVGIAANHCYSYIAGVSVYQNAYVSFTAFFMSCVYLLMTAFLEELAWRGFLLERLPFKKKIHRILFVGVIWAMWHMPMWVIRNSLGMEQIGFLCVWTLLISIVLGETYDRCRNVLLTSVLHATFNACYLAPIQYNIPVLAILIGACALFGKNRQTGQSF
ncbi:MAG: CPBP family intramembrane metalloprotease [Oscillospiraceae bacterium]|nr:CPBP family intramembrane metalloprotease [Oscillospiraceae bacterium]